MFQYDWPGNVRELENAIERAILLEKSQVLQVDSLPSALSPTAAAERRESAILPMEEVERRAIAHALEVSDWNVATAARALGLNRVTLYRKLKKYELSSQPTAFPSQSRSSLSLERVTQIRAFSLQTIGRITLR